MISGFPINSANIANFEGTGIGGMLNITGKAGYRVTMGGNGTTAGIILSNITGNQGDDIGTGDNLRFNGGVTYFES